MTRKRTREYKNGDTLTAYINNTVDDVLLDWLNKQSDVTGLIFLALLKLYEQTGHIDVVDYIPRRYSLDVPSPNLPVQKDNLSKDTQSLTKESVPTTNLDNTEILLQQIKVLTDELNSIKNNVDKQKNTSSNIQEPIVLNQVGSDKEVEEESSWDNGLKGINVDNY